MGEHQRANLAPDLTYLHVLSSLSAPFLTCYADSRAPLSLDVDNGEAYWLPTLSHAPPQHPLSCSLPLASIEAKGAEGTRRDGAGLPQHLSAP